MKIPQVESDIDLEVVNSYTTDLSGINNCTRNIVRYYFRLYILKWRFNINNLVLNVRLYIQVNILTSVADEQVNKLFHCIKSCCRHDVRT
jgi:hypothetical protein